MLLFVTEDVEDSSIFHILKLIHPKLDYQLQLAKKMELLEALKVCSLMVLWWSFHCKRLKGKGGVIALNGSPFQSYGASPAVWDHIVLPATWHRWTCPSLTPSRYTGTRFTYPKGMEGWVDLGGWLHTEMVYLPTGIHINLAQCRVTLLIWSDTLQLRHASNRTLLSYMGSRPDLSHILLLHS